MKLALICLAVLLLMLLPWPANTQQDTSAYPFDSGSAFLRTCKVDNVDAQTIMCGFYAKGIGDGFMVAELQHNTQRTICPRTAMSADQAVRIIRKFAEDNPELLDLPVMILGYKAFQKAFPCSDTK